MTVPYEGEWTMQAIAVDTAGQSDLRSADRDLDRQRHGHRPDGRRHQPGGGEPADGDARRSTMAPGSPLTFSGSATDDEGLDNVEISLRNTTTRENLASDGTWGADVDRRLVPDLAGEPHRRPATTGPTPRRST